MLGDKRIVTQKKVYSSATIIYTYVYHVKLSTFSLYMLHSVGASLTLFMHIHSWLTIALTLFSFGIVYPSSITPILFNALGRVCFTSLSEMGLLSQRRHVIRQTRSLDVVLGLYFNF